VSHPAAVESAPRRAWSAPFGARSPTEAHRVSTPLELLFDLVIVVATARAASGLHHDIAEGHAAAGVLTYAMVFFGIWWAWVNFTWFASAYDNDCVVYRLLVLLQLTGALVFAAGVPAFWHGDLRVGVLGYVIMRLALVTLWLRAARSDPPRRSCDLRYAMGVLTLQVAWVGLLFVPAGLRVPGFFVLAAGEMLVPVWAERAAHTTWHPHHIAERYGLFTLITLGESILAASLAVQSATEAGTRAAALLPIIAGGLLIVYSFWWLYFERAAHQSLGTARTAFVWGYTHYFVFAAAAAVGAGLAVSVDQATQHGRVSEVAAGAAVALPVALFLASLWVLHGRGEKTVRARVAAPLVIGAVLLAPFTGQAVLVIGLLMAALTAFKVVIPDTH
jgi:low temperature requirement protein LtrA